LSEHENYATAMQLQIDILSALPVLLDLKAPFELEMGVVVVVDELGSGCVLATD
jgi:hypothetical protein